MKPVTLVRWAGIVLLGIFVLMQFVPYGRNHTNPPVRQEPVWDSPQTAALARRACFDCHSNQTQWPWYSNIAPASWLVQNDVEEGRRKLNFSEWDLPQKEADEAAEQVQKGKMPPWFYLPLHAQARLSQVEKQALMGGLQATLGRGKQHGEQSGESVGEHEQEHEH
ncbi:MAG: hypothetical protein DKINENOH_04019 [bacterium]|nr:hypothetical protein [bacterium]